MCVESTLSTYDDRTHGVSANCTRSSALSDILIDTYRQRLFNILKEQASID